MDASKKQREPVAFKSLAELKRFIRPGVELKTVSHANHADMVGLTRVVTTVQTVGFYSKIKDQPEHPFSTCNHGKGFYTDFGKAGNYIFDGTTIKVKDKVGREQPYIIINDTKPVQRWTMLPICRVSHAHGENVCRTLTNFRM